MVEVENYGRARQIYSQKFSSEPRHPPKPPKPRNQELSLIGQCGMGRMVNGTGTDNHQMTDIKIGTVGALAKSNRGDVIIVMNKAACTGKRTTILSVLQPEHHGNLVAAKATEAKGGQKMITPEGCAFPLSTINGLACLKMRRCTDEEFDTSPHVILTSNEQWNPREHDKQSNPDDADFMLKNPANHHLLPHCNHDARGEHTGQLAEQL